MIKYLKDIGAINVEKLLLMKGKSLKLSDEEIFILLLIYMFSSNKQTVTPMLLMKYSSLQPYELDDVLSGLLEKKWIFNRSGTIILNRLIDRLLVEQDTPVQNDVSLVDVFEENIGRALSPMELETIKEWINTGYDEEMIIKALKEAVKSNILTFRYIDGILQNWKKNGIKERYIEEQPKERIVEESHYEWWKDE